MAIHCNNRACPKSFKQPKIPVFPLKNNSVLILNVFFHILRLVVTSQQPHRQSQGYLV